MENVGKLTERLLRIFHNNPSFANVRPPCFADNEVVPLAALLPNTSQSLLDFIVVNSICVLMIDIKVLILLIAYDVIYTVKLTLGCM